ncbi:unnamed protein product [Rhizoctonia solani]|uniref:Transmembrane protein n=1 Tax=Rhizoctonia solani TaxID=456999 RepID=A0A8H3A6J8_9AGAM|nr:unnamed protein product [Rhizoctonia solani]
MVLRPDVIAWVLVWAFWLGQSYVLSAPLTTSTSGASLASTSTRSSNPTSNPFPYGNSDAANSDPSTTIIIVCVVGSLALLGGAWGMYSCLVSKRKPPTPTVVGSGGTNAEPTTMIYIPGEQPAMAAIPALRYDAPLAPTQVDNEALEVGPGVILPPPPAYDVATAGQPFSQAGENPASPPELKRERTESMWKDLLVSQGRS